MILRDPDFYARVTSSVQLIPNKIKDRNRIIEIEENYF